MAVITPSLSKENHEDGRETSDLELHKTHTQTPASRGPQLELTQSRVAVPQSTIHEVAFVAIIISAQFMTQAALAQAIAPLTIIGTSFGIHDPGQLSWFAAAYSLTVGTFILIAGRLGDIYGHKQLFVFGYLWFALWSLLAGFSVYSTVIFFDVCRAMQGIGPAFLLPNAIAILGRTYEQGMKQNIIFSLLGATAPTGFVVGAVFTSLLARFAWWPWAYWITAIVAVLLGVAAILVLPKTPVPPREDDISVWQRTDVAGCLTGIAGLVLINVAWNQGPVAGWTTPYVYILLIIGFLIMAVFFYVEEKAVFPLLPIKQLNSEAAFVLGCIATGWGAFGIWVFYFWQFQENLRHNSPLLSSAMMVPCCFSGLVAALATGFLLSHISPSWVMLVSLVAFTVGTVLVATAPIDQTYWGQTFVSIIVMPFGMDMSFPAATIVLSNALPRRHQGAAASLVNTILNYSISISLGMAGTIEVHVNNGGTTDADVLMGYRGAWYFGIGLGCLGIFIAMAFVLHTKLHERRQIEADGEKPQADT